MRSHCCDFCAHSQACSGPDVGLLFGAIVVALVLVWCVYCVVARENRAKKMDSFALVSIVCSQFVTLFQMLGVLNTLSVAWPEPFATIVEMGSLMNFKLEVLNVGCVLSTTPLHRYVANAFAFVVLTLCMVGCHFLHVMVFHFAQFRRPTSDASRQHCSGPLVQCLWLFTSRYAPPVYNLCSATRTPTAAAPCTRTAK